MAVTRDNVYEDATQIVWKETGPNWSGVSVEWKPGTEGYNDQQIRQAIDTEIDALRTFAGMLRDTNQAFTNQQLRNGLARLCDDVAKLARLALGRLEAN